MFSRQEEIDAANRLEELLIAGKEIVIRIRKRQAPELTYALLYLYRREIGHIIKDLGCVGTPPSVHQVMAAKIIREQISDD